MFLAKNITEALHLQVDILKFWINYVTEKNFQACIVDPSLDLIYLFRRAVWTTIKTGLGQCVHSAVLQLDQDLQLGYFPATC